MCQIKVAKITNEIIVIIIENKKLYGKCSLKRQQLKDNIEEVVQSLQVPRSCIYYSKSYSSHYALAAITTEKEIGIDIEQVNRVEKAKDALDQLFQDSSLVANKLAAAERWCIHEVVGKIEKIGLRYPIMLSSIRQETCLTISQEQFFMFNMKNKQFSSNHYSISYYYKDLIKQCQIITVYDNNLCIVIGLSRGLLVK